MAKFKHLGGVATAESSELTDPGSFLDAPGRTPSPHGDQAQGPEPDLPEAQLSKIFSHVALPELPKDASGEYRRIAEKLSRPLEIRERLEVKGETIYLVLTKLGYAKRSKDFFVDHDQEYGHLIDHFEESSAQGLLTAIPPAYRNRLLGLPDDHEAHTSRKQSHVSSNPSLSEAIPSSRFFGQGSSKHHRKGADSNYSSARDVGNQTSDAGDEDSFDDSDEPVVRRRSARNQKIILKFGDHSPQKIAVPTRQTRSSARRRVVDSDDDVDMADGDEDEYRSEPSEIDELDLESEYSGGGRRGAKKGKEKKKRRIRPAQPAYGFVRDIEDLDAEDPNEDPFHVHRQICAKCSEPPAHITLAVVRKRGKRPGRKRRGSDAEFEDQRDEGTVARDKGGWVRCLHCCVATHWGCLVKPVRDEIIRAAREREEPAIIDDDVPIEHRKTVGVDETTDYVCNSCSRGGICIGCEAPLIVKEPGTEDDPPIPTANQEKAPPEKESSPASRNSLPSIAHLEVRSSSPAAPDERGDNQSVESRPPLLFRCITCKRPAHYAHLSPLEPSDDDKSFDHEDVARSYQNTWQCKDCIRWEYPLDKIIAWRPYPANAIDPPRARDQALDIKQPLHREYLVKWQRRSYRHLEWVPHQWLLNTAQQKLKNFCQTGAKVVGLLEPDHPDVIAALNARIQSSSSSGAVNIPSTPTPATTITTPARHSPSKAIAAGTFVEYEAIKEPQAEPNAELRVPRKWKTVDRILDATFWKPRRRLKLHVNGRPTIDDGDRDALVDGEEPDPDRVETVADREQRIKEGISKDHLTDIVWCFVKWQDLGFEEATWDSPPRPDTDGYEDYVRAYDAFIASRTIRVPDKSKHALAEFDNRAVQTFPLMPQPDFGSSMKLMPFQLQGLTWLFQCWNNHQASILADEMGLGKTVQIVTFIGHLIQEDCFPHLIVVPNSTISNWIREFEAWVPGVRAVQYCGDAEARKVLRDYEMYHKDALGNVTKNLKFHVLVTTYDTVVNPKEFASVFKSVKRWETLIVDEGQRLKSDGSQLFKRLDEVHSAHRILMTGTPLNNNIRELFNLMHFLDPKKWDKLDELEKEYAELTEEKVMELHERLRPYFLRRVKADVMKDLPPKVEVIVPISMAPIQKEVYKGLLSANVELLGSLANTANTRSGTTTKKINMNNLLMELRKCMQHPYIVSPDMEDQTVSAEEQHRTLIDASGKLRLLKMMLPKLKERGHRVLLFSQFKLALDVIEDMLHGEGYKFLRLDGDKKQSLRQKDMDLFNKEDSEYFIYLLSTRAGGVGINLWSADTVIMYDPDFNPHQDLQAIARSHRMGQKKKVLVFKFMIKDAAEEKIIQAGKKKLVLDHLIVQKMDDDSEEPENVQSILSFGAKRLFENEGDSEDIKYNDADVEKLIDKVEQEEPEVPDPAQEGSGLGLGFAKVYEAARESFGEVGETVEDSNADYWERRIAQANAEKAKREAETTGRGAKRKAAAGKPKTTYLDDLELSPDKSKPKNKGKGKVKPKRASDDEADDWARNSRRSASSEASSDPADGARLSADDHDILEQARLTGKPHKANGSKPNQPIVGFPAPAPFQNENENDLCQVCGKDHPDGKCPAVSSKKNLLHAKAMLEANLLADLSPDERDDHIEAIAAIDEKLAKMAATAARRSAQKQAREQLRRAQLAAAAVAGPQTNGDQAAGGPSTTLEHFVPPVIYSPYANFPADPSANGGGPSIGAIPNQATTSGTKRSAETGPAVVARKKAKADTSSVAACALCGQRPHHLVKECPITRRGLKSMKAKLVEISSNPDLVDGTTHRILYDLYMKKKAKRAAQGQVPEATEEPLM